MAPLAVLSGSSNAAEDSERSDNVLLLDRLEVIARPSTSSQHDHLRRHAPTARSPSSSTRIVNISFNVGRPYPEPRQPLRPQFRSRPSASPAVAYPSHISMQRRYSVANMHHRKSQGRPSSLLTINCGPRTVLKPQVNLDGETDRHQDARRGP